MPAPITTGRNAIEYLGIRRDGITLKIDNVNLTFDASQADGIPAAITGRALTFSADDTVTLAIDADAIIGRLEQVNADLTCTMQFKGFCNLPVGTGATVTRGLGVVGTRGTTPTTGPMGYVRQVASAVAAELSRQGGTKIWNTANTNTGGGGDGTCVVDLGG
jgi:hypothetical protein